MPFLEEEFNYGKQTGTGVSEDMLRAMEDAYSQTAVEVNRKADIVVRSSAPTGTPDANTNIPSTTDINYRNGTIWIYQTGAIAPITSQVFIKSETIINGGNKTALWVRLA